MTPVSDSKAHSARVCVVGGVAAGPKAASRLRRLFPAAQITLIDENPLISHGGCGIPFYVAGEINSLDALRSTSYGAVRDADYFQKFKNITVLAETRAQRIDRKAKTLLVRDLQSGEERSLPYDRLVLATGSRPRLPQLEDVPESGGDGPQGYALANVYTATRLESARAMRDACASGKVNKAVVVGGGFIGLEMAVALAEMWDIKTTVLEAADQLLPGALSPGLADMVRHDLEAAGVQVFTGEKLRQLEGNTQGKVARVLTSTQTLDADLVVIAAGFIPNTALAQDAGLDLDPASGGLLVDDQLRTSDPNIYAAGDCVAIPHLVTGSRAVFPFGSLANRQGRVLASNLAADLGCKDVVVTRFSGAVGTFALKLFTKSVCGVGLTLGRALAAGFDAVSVQVEQLDRAHFYPEKDMLSLELVVDKPSRRVLGLQGFSANGNALKARIDAAATLLQFGKPLLDDLGNAETAYAPPFSAALDVLNVVAHVADNVLAGRMQALTARDFAALWQARGQNNTFFVDARPAKAARELAEKYPDQWHALPLEDVFTRWNELPTDRPLALICNTGLRAYETLVFLRSKGLTSVRNSMGGMQAMLKRGEDF